MLKMLNNLQLRCIIKEPEKTVLAVIVVASWHELHDADPLLCREDR